MKIWLKYKVWIKNYTKYLGESKTYIHETYNETIPLTKNNNSKFILFKLKFEGYEVSSLHKTKLLVLYVKYSFT